jgi:hypothetical protein
MGGTGLTGAALIGSGGSSSTDYVDTGWPTNLSGDFTISFWVNNFPAGTALNYLFGDPTAGPSFRAFYSGAAGEYGVLIRFSTVGGTDVTIPNVGPGPSAVDVVYDSSVPEVRSYVNGALVLTTAQAGLLSAVGTGPFKVGGYSTSAGMPAGALMDDFKIYSRAIDLEENSRQSWLTTNPVSGTVAPGATQDVWVVADAAGLIGGEYDGEVLLLSNDPVSPDTSMPVGLTVYGEPRIFVDPLTLDFGTLFVGGLNTLQVTVTDTGTFPLNVTNITTTDPDFTVDTTFFTVGVGESFTVNVTFNPQTVQSYTEIMNIFNDDPTAPVIPVTLQGVAIEAPIVSTSPASFDKTLGVNETTTDTLTISNLGNSPLIFNLSFAGVVADNISLDRIGDQSLLNNEIIARGKKIPLSEFKNRQVSFQNQISLNSEQLSDKDYMNSISELEHAEDAISFMNSNASGLQPIEGIRGEEIFGTPTNPILNGPRSRGNMFSCTSSTNLIEHRLYLNPSVATQMWLLVYEGDVQFGIYNLVSAVDVSPQGPGEGWYSSGPINVDLVAGKYYCIIASFEQLTTYYNQNPVPAPYPIPASFGELFAGAGWHWAPTSNFPPDPTQNVPAAVVGDPVAYYQTIVTGAGTSWLSADTTSGTVPAAGSMDIELTFNSSGLVGGDYYADVVVSSNDPVTPEDSTRAHLEVIGQPAVSLTPNPLVMNTIFTGTTVMDTLFVNNIGSDTLHVSNVTSTNSLFTVDTSSFVVDPPGGVVEVFVTYSPLVANVDSGYILVASDDPVTPLDSVLVIGTAVEAPVAVINAQFTNPVQINEGDSTDVFINMSNSGGSDLTWSASLSSVPGSMPSYVRPVFGPVEGFQYADMDPDPQTPSGGINLEDIWDLQFAYDVDTPSGLTGIAGAETDGTYLYGTKWNGVGEIVKLDLAGNYIETFTIPGVVNLRDLAYDGQFFYGSDASSYIWQMDFDMKLLVGTITTPASVRAIAYDSDLDGFWYNNFSTDLHFVDRNGALLNTITGPPSMYGCAYDNLSAGGPYLWIFTGTSIGGGCQVEQYDLATQTLTGTTHSVSGDLGDYIAGGLFLQPNLIPGTYTLGGLAQGSPDLIFGYELGATGGEWIKLLPPTSGTIATGDQFDLPVRIYGTPTRLDTAYVNIATNDPALPMASVLVIRDLITGIGDLETLPTTYDIAQNYPNPFNPTTTINYQLPQVSDVKLVIYNVLGQKVRTLVNTSMEAGYHSVVWDGLNQQSSAVASGIYIYRFEAGDFQKTMKLMLLK